MSVPLGFDAAEELKRSGRSKWLQIGAIIAGGAGLGALVWWFVFRKVSPCDDLQKRYALAKTATERTALLTDAQARNCLWLHEMYAQHSEEAYAALGGALPSDSPAVRAAKIAQAKADEAAQIARAGRGGFGGL